MSSSTESSDDRESIKYLGLQVTYSSGRWTEDEHRRFLEAMQLYGKNWKLVQNYIGTRVSSQIRSHAQKYFNKISNQFLQGKTKERRSISVMVDFKESSHSVQTQARLNSTEYENSNINNTNDFEGVCRFNSPQNFNENGYDYEEFENNEDSDNLFNNKIPKINYGFENFFD